MQVVGTFEADGLPAIVFDFVNGVDLETEIYGSAAVLETGHPLPVERARKIALGVLNGLDYAHQRGLVHRDVKASNILLERGTDRALVSDFGLVMNVAVRRTTRYGMMPVAFPT